MNTVTVLRKLLPGEKRVRVVIPGVVTIIITVPVFIFHVRLDREVSGDLFWAAEGRVRTFCFRARSQREAIRQARDAADRMGARVVSLRKMGAIPRGMAYLPTVNERNARKMYAPFFNIMRKV